MATTTNYGWTTPDDTALVKDGAAAIRSLGSSIDSTLKTQIDAQIPDSIIDAKGDLIAGTADNTPARLAVGTNNQVLTADSSTATGLKWAAPDPLTTKGDLFTYTTTEARLGVGTNGQVLAANSSTATGLEWQTISSGGLTLLSTTTLSGASTTISSISSSYTDLWVFIYGVTNNTANGFFYCDPNASNTISSGIYARSNTSSLQSFSGGSIPLVSAAGGNEFPTRTNATNAFTLRINQYSSTASRKTFQTTSAYFSVYSDPGLYSLSGGGGINTTSAISSLVFANGGGTFAGGTVLIYGVK